MGGIVVVSGLPGVGKSTVLNLAIEKLRKGGLSIKLVNYGTIMLDEAVKNNLVQHRDKIRKLKVAKQLELQRLAAKKISELAENVDLLIVDTHLFIVTPRGRWPGLSLNNLKNLDVKQIIVVEADPEEIAERRVNDNTRIREFEGLTSIKEDLSYNRYLAAALSIYTSSPAFFVSNHNNLADVAAEHIYNVLKKLVEEL